MKRSEGQCSDAVLSTPLQLLVSILFWSCLGFAALFAGLLVVAPKMVHQERLSKRFEANARQLERLASETARLERLGHALREDREFRSRVAVAELSLAGTPGRKLSFDSTLNFDARRATAIDAPPNHAFEQNTEWLSVEWMARFVEGGRYQRVTIVGVVGLTIAAFLLLNDAAILFAVSLVTNGFRTLVHERYRRA